MRIRVLICDDHEVVRSGLGSLLEGADIEVVGAAANVSQLLSLAKAKKPDVVLLDVRLADEDGLDAVEELLEGSPDTAVIVLSTYDNPTYVARSIALGARDYLLKDASRDEILNAIKLAVANEPPLESSLLKQVQYTMQKRKDRVDSKEVPLTNRELQVLRHIALGLSNKEIGTSLAISVETVKEHVQNILRKLDSADRTAAAVWAVKSGLTGG
ncbi:MAG: response regulator transcription factor [Pirellulaceae bacterium]|nr:response regulator transcription factor [Pirellulaceae bacterium]